MPLASGVRLGPYEIVALIGTGGMGDVYKARDTRLGRTVAIKVLPASFASDPDRRRRFEDEARAASALNHPNIVTVHDIASEDGCDFMVLEYVQGRTLSEMIGRKGMRLGDVLKYGAQVAGALAAAHAAGIVHRDLKPGNVMVTETGLVKVLDFGLAKLVELVTDDGSTASEAERLKTMEGRIVGTPSYMSPEQALGRPVDARTDVFSFGSVLYEMATGRRAFAGQTTISTLSMVVDHEPPAVSTLIHYVPHELEKLIHRCLRKDPERRIQHLADVKLALEDLKEESDSGKLTLAPAAEHRSKWRWMLLAAAVVPLLAGGGWFLSHQAGMPQPPLTVVSLTSHTGSESYPAFSPDGNQVAFAWDGEDEDNFDIYVKMVGSSAALRLTTGPAEDLAPAWSPDGRQIAFVREEADRSGIYVTSPLGGGERKLLDAGRALPSKYNRSISWSPDGNWLAIAEFEWGQDNGIFLISGDRGEKRRVTSNRSFADWSPAISPDGRFLAYASCSGGFACDIHLVELGPDLVPKGPARRLTNRGVWLGGIAWTPDARSLVYAASQSVDNYPHLERLPVSGRATPERLALGASQALYPAIARVGNRLVYSQGRLDSDIWKVELGTSPKNLIASTLHDYGAQFSPDGRRIAFESARSGRQEVWVSNHDGSNPVQLTDRLGRHQGTPRWSPDGRWIAFDSQGEDGYSDVYVVDASGGRPHRLTSDPSTEWVPSWSRDGRWIYFGSFRGGRSDVWRIPANGGEAVRLTDAGGNWPFESWDGSTVLYTKTYFDLTARPVAGGPERQILDSIIAEAYVPVEDGIYYFGRDARDRAYPLQFYEFASGKNRVLAWLEGPIFNGLTVSPDRKTVLYSRYKPPNWDLMLLENFR